MAIVSLLSSLPYLNDILAYSDGSIKSWVPNIGVRDFLADENGRVFKYSTYHKTLYYVCLNLFIFFGWFGWYRLKTFKPYRKALLLPLLSISYQLIIIVSSARSSWFNQPEVKVMSTLVIAFVFGFLYIPKKKNRTTLKLVSIWVLFFLISLLPYYHDILTTRAGELRSFIPNIGLEQLLTIDNLVLGWNNYRVFMFIACIHLFAQIGWAGWFFDARNRLFRPFLLVPVMFNLYEIIIITLDVQNPAFSKPDWKLYTTIILTTLIAINLYFNSDKALRWMEAKTNNYNQSIKS